VGGNGLPLPPQRASHPVTLRWADGSVYRPNRRSQHDGEAPPDGPSDRAAAGRAAQTGHHGPAAFGDAEHDCGTPARELGGGGMINKQPQRGGRVKVTFTVPTDEPEAAITVVGDFNGWEAQATPLKRRGQSRTASITLDAGRRYAFRYRRADGAWFNDDAADDYEPNEYGGYNCIIDLAGI
jgi:hypothetical protein